MIIFNKPFTAEKYLFFVNEFIQVKTSLTVIRFMRINHPIGKLYFFIVNVLLSFSVNGQSLTTGQEVRYNPITTAVPFLTIAPDSRHGAMGDAGAATSVDANAQHWNPSKYAFAEEQFGFSLTYTPWLRHLVNDIDMAYLSGFYRIDENQVLGSSLRYFSMGDLLLTDQGGNNLTTASPNEFAFDMSYSRKLSELWSGGVAFRYIRSDLSGGIGHDSYVPGNAFGTDISFSFRKGWQLRRNIGRWVAVGINLSNIGSKISYDEGQHKKFLPANLRLGSTYFVQADKLHSFAFSLDFNKLLVPTPSQTISTDGEGGTIVLPDSNTNGTVLSALFSSFSDAPGGLKEELQEINISTGVEYWYNRQFAIRTGYFHEHENKGNRKFFSAGLGLKMKICSIDISYIIPSQPNSPLANTVRFTLLFDRSSFGVPKKEEQVTGKDEKEKETKRSDRNRKGD